MKNEKDVLSEVSGDNDFGTINISEEVISVVAAQAASDIEGIAGMTQGLAGGLTELFGKKNLSKGVKVLVEEKAVIIDMYIIAVYGVNIQDAAWKIQQKVKAEVESMTGLDVSAVNVHVEGVSFPKEVVEVSTETD